MSQQDLVSATLSQADYDAIMAALDDILDRISPFAIDLSPEERQALMKQGPKSLQFVEGIRTLATQNPDAVPSVVDMAEFNKDAALCAQLYAINTKATTVAEKLSDTLMATGSDCMTASLTIYRVLRALRLAGLDANLTDLGRRFERIARSQTPVTP